MEILPTKIYHPQKIANYIDYIGYFDIDKNIQQRVILPLGTVQIIFQLGSAISHKTSFSKGWQRRPEIFIGGPYKTAYEMKFESGSKVLMVLFKLGKAPQFFKEKISHFTNKLIKLEDIWGNNGKILAEKIFTSSENIERVKILDQFLAKQFRPHTNLAVEFSINSMVREQGLSRITKISRKSGYSASHFRKIFREEVGLSAKSLQKIIRIHSLIKCYNYNPSISLGELAYQFNYFDQSHFIKDFKSITTLKPGDYFNISNSAL